VTDLGLDPPDALLGVQFGTSRLPPNPLPH
jgi:hypothetical protein